MADASIMAAVRPDDDPGRAERLTQELAEAELFSQKLYAYIVAIRDELADGQLGRALSLCNRAITEIDNATDVVAPSPQQKEQ